MSEGYIDTVTAAGLVSGWARPSDPAHPAFLELWLAGTQVGKVIAASFRRDLLTAGIGHGHYGFRCRIRTRDVSTGALELREASSGALLATVAIEPGKLAAGPRPQLQTVESLLHPLDRWALEDVAGHLNLLDLDHKLHEFGPATFMAMVYRFVLGRWPGAAEQDSTVAALRRGDISAAEAFKLVLELDECKNIKLAPASPFHPSFPFNIRPRGPQPQRRAAG